MGTFSKSVTEFANVGHVGPIQSTSTQFELASNLVTDSTDFTDKLIVEQIMIDTLRTSGFLNWTQFTLRILKKSAWISSNYYTVMTLTPNDSTGHTQSEITQMQLKTQDDLAVLMRAGRLVDPIPTDFLAFGTGAFTGGFFPVIPRFYLYPNEKLTLQCQGIGGGGAGGELHINTYTRTLRKVA